MHTVIILSKHSSNLLREFRFLFQPFVKNDTISFCDWNESGTDIKTSVPELYKSIKGRTEWRAIIISAEPVYGRRNGPIPNEKNPFDFSSEISKDFLPQDSSVPIIRLTHMLCGYPSAPVKNFEEGYEYVNEVTGETCRVRASELSKEEFYALSEKYKEGIKQIYMKEKDSEEIEQKRKMLEEKYSFVDVRPQEVYLISLRKHPDDENYIYDSWKSPFEMESSDFCRRNNYPGLCRFLCFSITNPENSRYMKELTEFWLSVLTMSVNRIPASSLQAYKLYRLEVKISKEEFSEMLNQHLNKMEAAFEFVKERLCMKSINSIEDGGKIVENQLIPVIFSESSGRELYIDTSHLGLSRDCPSDELEFWNTQVKEKEGKVERFLKMPRRAIDRSALHVKERAAGFFDEQYELDRFQIEELEDELDVLELELLTSDTHSVIDENKLRKDMQKLDNQVKKDIAKRMRKGVVVQTGVSILLIYMIGYFPYVFNSLQLGKKQFFASLGVMFGGTLLVIIGGLIVLFLFRRQMAASMERFNKLMQELINSVNGCGKKFEKYFSTLCTYMKAQSIYEGLTKRKDAVSARSIRLRTHKQALKSSIERDEELATAFGIKRNADFEKNVTRFFDEDKLPKDNRLYFYEIDEGKTEIPLNTAGDMLHTPYKFIEGLIIEREDLYEEVKGETVWQS